VALTATSLGRATRKLNEVPSRLIKSPCLSSAFSFASSGWTLSVNVSMPLLIDRLNVHQRLRRAVFDGDDRRRRRVDDDERVGATRVPTAPLALLLDTL